jgi:hypothetical protein
MLRQRSAASGSGLWMITSPALDASWLPQQVPTAGVWHTPASELDLEDSGLSPAFERSPTAPFAFDSPGAILVRNRPILFRRDVCSPLLLINEPPFLPKLPANRTHLQMTKIVESVSPPLEPKHHASLGDIPDAVAHPSRSIPLSAGVELTRT